MAWRKPKANPSQNEINVLLLGETGVGKSTFINSFANYIRFEDFDSALREEPRLLIPLNATVTDVDGNSVNIRGGVTNENEIQEVGTSATQNVESYVIQDPTRGNLTIRLIDSPGMGDTRGLDVDNENLENIFNFLAELKELHAICFLMRPNNTRNTAYFEYCLKQIWSRLDISACQNIIFLFTNSRGTDFTPADTLPCLRKTVEELKANNPQVQIPVNVKQNIFCMDNEPTKAWLAVKQGVPLTERFMKGCHDSWEQSSKVCKKLCAYIAGEDKNHPLQPHQLQSTTSINEARRLILQLSEPTAEISQLIDDNLRLLNKHKLALKEGKLSVSELKENLFIPTVKFEVIPLDHPMTVCASPRCMDVVVGHDVNRWHYKQICCKKCYIKFIPKNKLGSRLLWACSTFSMAGQCKQCSCHMSLHQRIFYMTKVVDEKIVDLLVAKDLSNNETLLQETEKIVREMDQRTEELEEELKIITESTAQFTLFLEKNAIVPYIDEYRGYIQILIEREKSLGEKADASRIANLQIRLDQYDNTKKNFDSKLDKTLPPITAEDVGEIINKLYNLKHNGSKIKELCTQKSKLTKKEFERKNKVVEMDTSRLFSLRKKWNQ